MYNNIFNNLIKQKKMILRNQTKNFKQNNTKQKTSLGCRNIPQTCKHLIFWRKFPYNKFVVNI